MGRAWGREGRGEGVVWGGGVSGKGCAAGMTGELSAITDI